MGLERSLKIAVTTLKTERDALLAELRDAELFEPVPIEDAASDERAELADVEACDERAAQAAFLVHVLARFEPPKPPLASISDTRLELSRAEFLERARSFPLERVYLEVASLEERIAEIEKDQHRLASEAAALEPYAPLEFATGTYVLQRGAAQHLGVKLFQVRPHDADVLDELRAVPLAELLVLGEPPARATGAAMACCLLYHRDALQEVEAALQRHGVVEFDYEKLVEPGESPAAAFRKRLDLLSALRERRQRLEERLAAYAAYIDDARIAVDYWRSEGARARAARAGAHTATTTILVGWVLESHLDRVREIVERRPFAHLDVLDAEEGETVPVRLRNHPFVRPLELLTRFYGMPSPSELDPTPFFSIWFLLYFGMCVGDAGYGLLLAVVAVVAERKLRLTEGGKSFAFIFKWAGVASVVVGVLTGSYFALDSALVPDALERLRVLDTINDPRALLVVALALGVLQILFGIALAVVNRARTEGVLVALLTEGGRFLLVLGAAGLVTVGGMSAAPAVQRVLSTVFTWLTAAGASFIVLFSAGFAVSWVKRLLLGLYNLYGATGYLGDIISYARLMAIGLASGLIGMSVNIIVGLIATNPIGTVAGAFMFILGHLFNIAIGLIGAFVHPMRLQFVEFFKQFYGNGGKEFEPLAWVQENILLATEGKEAS